MTDKVLTAKIGVINARIRELIAQRGELEHKRLALKETPATKRPKPRAPSKKVTKSNLPTAKK